MIKGSIQQEGIIPNGMYPVTEFQIHESRIDRIKERNRQFPQS